MGTKRVGLARTQALIQNLKRELTLAGTSFGLSGEGQETHGPGAVSGSTTPPQSRVVKVNGEIITTVAVDMQNLSASAGAANTIIGAETPGGVALGNAYLLQWSTDTNGVCYKVEMSCVEAPAGNGAGNALDIDLKLNSSTGGAQGATAGGATLITCAGGSWSVGETIQQLDAPISDGHAVFLVNGATVSDTGEAQYTAGRFIIKFYGHAADF